MIESGPNIGFERTKTAIAAIGIPNFVHFYASTRAIGERFGAVWIYIIAIGAALSIGLFVLGRKPVGP
jgi:hypothetical protein